MTEYYASHALAKAKQIKEEQYLAIKEKIMVDIRNTFEKGYTSVNHFIDGRYQYLFPNICDWLEGLGYKVNYEEEVDAHLDSTGYHKFVIDWSEPTDER